MSTHHLPISVDGCRGLMRQEEVAHLVYCPGEHVPLLFPWIYCHLGIWRQRATRSIAASYECDGVSSGMTSIGVWHERAKSRDTLYAKLG